MAARKKRLEHDKVNDLRDGIIDEILEIIIGRGSLLEEFIEEIFNALVEKISKIEILTPTHFVFELKSGMNVEAIRGDYLYQWSRWSLCLRT